MSTAFAISGRGLHLRAKLQNPERYYFASDKSIIRFSWFCATNGKGKIVIRKAHYADVLPHCTLYLHKVIAIIGHR